MGGELFASLGGFKSMMDMTKAVQKADDVASRDKALLKLQKEILAAQVAQALLVVRLSNLEKELARFEEAEKKRSDRKPSQAGTPPPFSCALPHGSRRKTVAGNFFAEPTVPPSALIGQNGFGRRESFWLIIMFS